MAAYYVEIQCWQHWPKVLIMRHKTGSGEEPRRYVPERTAARISVPRDGHTAIGHYECGECRGVVGAQDAHCKHCGCRLVEP